MIAKSMRVVTAAAALAALAACQDADDARRAADTPNPPSVEAARQERIQAENSPAEASPPAADAADEDADEAADAQAIIDFHGFGPARFGDDEESVRIAWGMPLETDDPLGEGCHYLFRDPRPANGYGIAFMIENGRFVRYDIDSVEYVAPGGGKVGMSADEILSRYEGRVESQPHKYVDDGRYLVVSPADGGPARIVFEVEGDSVTTWRIGVPPQVHYVEGCA